MTNRTLHICVYFLLFSIYTCDSANISQFSVRPLKPGTSTGDLQVTGHSPADGAVNIDINSQITITFGALVNINSVENAFYFRRAVDSQPVTGSFTWYQGNTFVFTPDPPLSYSEPYTLTVSGASHLGLPLAVFEMTFTTGTDGIPPYILDAGVTPDGNGPVGVISITPVIRIEFSEPMFKPSAESAFVLKRSSDNTIVTGSFAWSAGSGTDILEFSPSDPLDYWTNYTVTVDDTAKDASKEPTGYNYDPLLTFQTGHDGTAPTYTISPAHNQTNVPLSSSIIITWSEPMNQTAAQTGFCLWNGSTCAPGNFSWSGNIMTFTPNPQMGSTSTYYPVIYQTATDITGAPFAGTGGPVCSAPDQCTKFDIACTNTSTWFTTKNCEESCSCGWVDSGCPCGGCHGTCGTGNNGSTCIGGPCPPSGTPICSSTCSCSCSTNTSFSHTTAVIQCLTPPQITACTNEPRPAGCGATSARRCNQTP